MPYHTASDLLDRHAVNLDRHAVRGAIEECWEWSGPHDRDGYSASAATSGGKRSGTTGHRVAYILLRGDIPEGLILDHLCRNRGCVNPWHLEPVTSAENTRRQRLSGTCRKGGHDTTPENTITNREGYRRCRACTRQSSKRAKAKFHAKRAASAAA